MTNPDEFPDTDPAPAFDPTPPATDPELPTEPDIAPATDPKAPPTVS